ncbi:MAG: transglycosylase domain-containing protein [Bilophila wadsworthia]
MLLYEDRHFYRHPGVNPLSLLRASAGMLGGARRMGGSTITMQVARLRLGLSTTTLSGKFAQMARALQYEYHYGKGEILEAYFNLAPYGGNIEGVGAAARIYFRTTSDALPDRKPCPLQTAESGQALSAERPGFEAARPGCRCLPMPKTLRRWAGATASLARRVSPWEALPPLRVYGPGGAVRAPHVSERDASAVAGGSLCAPVSTAGCSGLWRGPLPDRGTGGVMA